MNRTASFILSSLLIMSCANTCSACETSNIALASETQKSELEERIDKYVNNFIGKNIAGAQISVTKNGKTIFSKGYGLADIEKIFLLQILLPLITLL